MLTGGLTFSLHISMVDPAFYLPVARAAEVAGFDRISMGDSIFYPLESDSRYPYTADGGREFLENKPFLEPFSIIPAMAAVTTRIQFAVVVLKLPVRHPVLVAKQASSVAVISGNRLRLGVGTSPWPDDFEILGVPYEGRGRRLEEGIAVIRGLTAGGYFEHHGEHYDFRPIKLAPVPTAPIPILVGGHSPINIQRAARFGDGWVAASGDRGKLAPMIQALHAALAEGGRSRARFEVSVGTPDLEDGVELQRLRELGVTDVRVRLGGGYMREPDSGSLASKLEFIERVGERVLSRLHP